MSGMTERIPVTVLGATGTVGQTFVRLLEGHPTFRVSEVAALTVQRVDPNAVKAVLAFRRHRRGP